MAKKSKKAFQGSKKANFAPTEITTFKFPPEIEYLIFEWAARIFPKDATTLSVLCRRIQPYVESVIYESLLIVPHKYTYGPDIAHVEHILPTLLSRPSAFFTAHVRNLCIRPDVSMDIAGIILSKCTAIRNLALLLEEGGYAPVVAPTAHTLTSLHIGRHTAREMAQCGIVFPNLSFLALHFYPPYMRIVPLEWIPSLRTVLLELEDFPLTGLDGWMQDIETALSTTAQLQVLMLNASRRSMPTVKKHMKGRNVADHIKVTLNNNCNMELEWRRLYKGKNCLQN